MRVTVLMEDTAPGYGANELSKMFKSFVERVGRYLNDLRSLGYRRKMIMVCSTRSSRRDLSEGRLGYLVFDINQTSSTSARYSWYDLPQRLMRSRTEESYQFLGLQNITVNASNERFAGLIYLQSLEADADPKRYYCSIIDEEDI